MEGHLSPALMTASILHGSWMVFPEVMVTPADYSVQPHSLPCTHQWPERDDRSLFHSKLKSQTSAVHARFSEMSQCTIRINELQIGLDEDGQSSVWLIHTSYSHLSPFLPTASAFFPPHFLLTAEPLTSRPPLVDSGGLNQQIQPDTPALQRWNTFPNPRRKPA